MKTKNDISKSPLRSDLLEHIKLYIVYNKNRCLI